MDNTSINLNTSSINKNINNETSEKLLKNTIVDAFKSTPKTNRQNLEAFKAINELRKENLCYLIMNLGGYEILEAKELDVSDNKSEVFVKIKINDKCYILRKTIYKDRFVNVTKEELNIEHNKNRFSSNKHFDTEEKNFGEFHIFKSEDIKGNDIELSNITTDKFELQDIDQNDVENIADLASKRLIKDEIKFQTNRLNRLTPFINGLFDTNIADNIKKELEQLITIIFNNDNSEEKLCEKFKAKEKLASLLSLIKTTYKKDKKMTDHFLMLTGICRAKNNEELLNEIGYLHKISVARSYFTERNKLNSLSDTEPFSGKKFIECMAIRAIKVNPYLLLYLFGMEIFKSSDTIGFELLDSYWGTPENIGQEKYNDRRIGYTGDRGNITSYSINADSAIQFLRNKENTKVNQNYGSGIVFVSKPSQDQIGGSVDKAVVTNSFKEYEYNTFKMETQDMAFALIFKDGKVVDVFFNKNFNGEFCVRDEDGKNKYITEEELKIKILEISNNDNGNSLSKFLNEQLVLEKLIERNFESIENELNLDKLPDFFQNFINKAMDSDDYSKQINKINSLIEVYYYNKSIINEKLVGDLLENDDNYINFLYNTYNNPVNLDKLIKYYDIFNEDYKNKIIDSIFNEITNLINDDYSKNYFRINQYLSKLKQFDNENMYVNLNSVSPKNIDDIEDKIEFAYNILNLSFKNKHV